MRSFLAQTPCRIIIVLIVEARMMEFTIFLTGILGTVTFAKLLHKSWRKGHEDARAAYEQFFGSETRA